MQSISKERMTDILRFVFLLVLLSLPKKKRLKIMARITIPYAVADFADLRERGFYYVDKTNYIQGLKIIMLLFSPSPPLREKSAHFNVGFLLRPYKRHPALRNFWRYVGGYTSTQEHNQYLVIRYDFSKMVMANDMQGLARNFDALNCSPVEIMVEHNRDLFGDFQFTNRGNAAQM